MKTVLIILFLCLSIFASTLEKNYDDLNAELDKISAHLSVEEKVSLFYLVLSTHEKITTSLSVDKTKIEDLNRLEKDTLETLSKLQKDNTKLTPQQIQDIKKLYLIMKKNGVELIKENLINPKNTQEVVNKSSNILIFIFSLLSLFLGLLVGYLTFYNTYIKKAKANDPRFIIEDLQNHNTNLLYKLESLQSLKESDELDNKKEKQKFKDRNTKLEDENEFLKENLIELQNEHAALQSELDKKNS